MPPEILTNAICKPMGARKVLALETLANRQHDDARVDTSRSQFIDDKRYFGARILQFRLQYTRMNGCSAVMSVSYTRVFFEFSAVG